MIRKSVQRFSGKIMRKITKAHHALWLIGSPARGKMQLAKQ